ncbi:MAG: hypothetical protein RXR47_02880 [Nitrososphaeria archaeon]|jgi:hypothetical protein
MLSAGEAALLAAFLGHNPMETPFSMLPAKGVQLIIASDPTGYAAIIGTHWFPEVIAPT